MFLPMQFRNLATAQSNKPYINIPTCTHIYLFIENCTHGLCIGGFMRKYADALGSKYFIFLNWFESN
jgi:hypothetical protein